MTTYFITGATGAVGSALCEHLLALPDTRLLLLARADDDVHLQKRGETLAKYWGITADKAARVEWLRGDTTAASFGLAAADWDAAAAKTTHVIHCAGAVRMNLPIEKARASAVFAAENVLAFARDVARLGQLKKLELVSTVGVLGRQPGLLTETWQGTNRDYHNTYEQAKAEAEVVMQKAIEAGLPATVHRPSMVVGSAATGKIIHFQFSTTSLSFYRE